MTPQAGSMSALPGSFEALDLGDVPETARGGAALPGARRAGARRPQSGRLRRTTMSSSGNGDGSARGVTRGGRDVVQLDASLEIAAPATIEPGGADKQLRPNPPVSALGYVSAEGTARIDDPEVKDQAAAIDDFCGRQGWELVSLVRDLQPATGRGLDRPALGYAIERLSRGDVSALVVTELARLCRSVAELGEILDALRGADARLVSLEPEIDTGTEFGRAAARILGAVSEWEQARVEARTRKGLAAARAQHAVRTAITPELKRRIVHMRAADMTLQAIADQLNQEGIPTPRGGAKWRPSSVQSALGYKRPSRMRPRQRQQGEA
jgi:DNA invertase Pin-like site-specific DNA recombinase